MKCSRSINEIKVMLEKVACEYRQDFAALLGQAGIKIMDDNHMLAQDAPASRRLNGSEVYAQGSHTRAAVKRHRQKERP